MRSLRPHSSLAEAVDRQVLVMQAQLDAMEMEQRAWVFVVSATPDRDLLFLDGRAILSVQFKLKNAGRKPARFAAIHGQFI
jgi:hypothetical protein